jgi:predicted O-methyltransferase YrrM
MSSAKSYKEIDGWFDYSDIYDFAVQRAKEPARFIEIGIWKGCSTAYLCQRIKDSGKVIDLHAIDHFGGTPEQVVDCDLEAVARENLKGYRVDIINRHSIPASRMFNDGTVDFYFDDGCHDYLSVRNNLNAYYPKMKPDGVMAGHDYTNTRFPGVKQAVDEFAKTHRYKVTVSRQSWIIELKRLNDV